MYKQVDTNDGDLFLFEEKFDRPFATIEQAIAFAETLEALDDEELGEIAEQLVH